jgi:hypothetical protein
MMSETTYTSIGEQPIVKDMRSNKTVFIDYAYPEDKFVEVFKNNQRVLVLSIDDAEQFAANLQQRLKELKGG